jgi:tripartite-type tricarboxylate transporter receptor subunit TctC
MKNFVRACICAGLVWGGSVTAQVPGKPVTLIVPTSSATVADITARLLQPALQQRLGVPVVVENRTGASGAIGMTAVQRAAPDGNTVLVGPSTMSMINLLQKDLPWQAANDFQPVSRMASSFMAIVVPPGLPVTTVPELIALAKKDPGKLNFSSPGIGTPHHLLAELFKQVTGVNVVHIPYKTSAAAVTDVAGGQVQFSFQPLHGVLPLVKAGKLRMIGTVTDVRTPWTLDTPTLKEIGIEGVIYNSWTGIFLPKGTPREITERYNREIAAILNSREVKEDLLRNGIVINYGGPEDMANQLRGDVAQWKRVVEQGRINLDEAR